MFENVRQAILEQREHQRLRNHPSRRPSAAELADRATAKEAPRWKVLTNDARQFTLLWEVAPGWYQHAWGDTPALLVSETEWDVTGHVDQDINLMTGTINRDIHPDWSDDDWERERVESNHDVFEALEATGFDAQQDAGWRN